MSKHEDFEETLLIGQERAVRVVWPVLDKPRQFRDKKGKESGKLRYEASFLLPDDHPDLKAHRQTLAKLIKQKWGAVTINPEGRDPGVYAMVDGRQIRLKFASTDGNELVAEGMAKGKDRSFAAGHTVLKTATEYPVPVFDARQRDKAGVPLRVSEPDAIKSLIYGGSYVAAEIKYRTYDPVGTNPPGITIYLQKICFVEDGDRIASEGGGDTFKAVQGAVVDTDPTGGAELDDEIPF